MQAIDLMRRPFKDVDLAPVPPGWTAGPPDFVGAGCGKAGSSWWYSLISAHPQVVPNRLGAKELHYFGHLGWRAPSAVELETYRRAFARPEGCISGEWTANYLYLPFTLESLAEAAPRTKIIVTLRNPVDRLASLLNQYFGVRAEFVGASAEGRRILELYSFFPEAAYQARVADGIARLRALFPREQLLFVQYEKAKATPDAELARTLRFLGIDDRWRHGQIDRPVNKRPYVVAKPTDSERGRIAEWFRDDVRRTAELVPSLDVDLWPDFAPARV